MTPTQLRDLAYAWSAIDKGSLENAGVLRPKQIGGSDWKRFNDDPMTFILKLPDDKLQKLSEVITTEQGR